MAGRSNEPGQGGRPSGESWALAEGFAGEDDVVMRARARAAELGLSPASSGTGAALRLLARLVDARHVVEVGTGTGVSGLWLLAGMRPDGVLTTVDTEGEHHRLARESFAAAGATGGRVRLITGRPLEVLPRLADAGYDLVLLDADPAEQDACLDEAIRMVRPGGVVALHHAFWHGLVADPAQRDSATVAVRSLGRRVADDPRLEAVMLPVGDGLVAAVRLPDDAD